MWLLNNDFVLLQLRLVIDRLCLSLWNLCISDLLNLFFMIRYYSIFMTLCTSSYLFFLGWLLNLLQTSFLLSPQFLWCQQFAQLLVFFRLCLKLSLHLCQLFLHRSASVIQQQPEALLVVLDLHTVDKLIQLRSYLRILFIVRRA